MSKTATVHAQQRWEYLELSRKTEGYLVNELNQLGEVGWELVNIWYHKQAKSGMGDAWAWTAFCKRPHAQHAPTSAAQQRAAAVDPEAAHKPARLEPSSQSGDNLDFAK